MGESELRREIILNAVTGISAADLQSGEAKKEMPLKIIPFHELKPMHIENAINTYAQGLNPKDIVVLCDMTLMGNGKKGLIFSTEGFYSWEMNTFRKKMPLSMPVCYEELEAVTSQKYTDVVFKFKDGIRVETVYGGIYTEFIITAMNRILKGLCKKTKPEKDDRKIEKNKGIAESRIEEIKKTVNAVSEDRGNRSTDQPEESIQENLPVFREVGPVEIPEMPQFEVKVQKEKAAPQTKAQVEAFQWAEALFWEAAEKESKSDQMTDAVKEMEKAAQMGSANAIAYMGLFYMVGLVVEKDETRGWNYIRKSESMGYRPVKPQKLELDHETTRQISNHRSMLRLRNKSLAEFETTEPAFPKDQRLRNYELRARQRARDFLCPKGGVTPSKQEIKQHYKALEEEYNKAHKKLGSIFRKNNNEKMWECALEMAWLYWLAGLNGLLPADIDMKVPKDRVRNYSDTTVCYGLAAADEKDMTSLWLDRLIAIDHANKIKKLYENFLARELGANEEEAKAAYERRIQEAYQKRIQGMQSILVQNEEKKENEEKERIAEEEARKAKQLKDEHDRIIKKSRLYEAEKNEAREQWLSDRQKKDEQYALHIQPYVEYLNTLFKLNVRKNCPELRPVAKRERTVSYIEDSQKSEYRKTFLWARWERTSSIGKEFLSLITPKGLCFLSDNETTKDTNERENLFMMGKAALAEDKLTEATECISRILPLESSGALYQLGLYLVEEAQKTERRLHDDYALVFKEWCFMWAWDCHITSFKKGNYRSANFLLSETGSMMYSEQGSSWMITVSMPDGSKKKVNGREIAQQICSVMFAESHTQDPDEMMSWGKYYEPDRLRARQYIVQGALAMRGIPESAVIGVELADHELFPETDNETKALYHRGYCYDIEGKDFRAAAYCYQEAAKRGYLPAAWRLVRLGPLIGLKEETIEDLEKQAEPLLQDQPLFAAMAIQGDFHALEELCRESDDTGAYSFCAHELSFWDPEMTADDLRNQKKKFEDKLDNIWENRMFLPYPEETLTRRLEENKELIQQLGASGLSTAYIASRIKDMTNYLEKLKRQKLKWEMEDALEELEEERLRDMQVEQEMAAYREKMDNQERAFNFMGGYYGTDTEAWIAGNVSNDDYFMREQLRKEREEKKRKELDSIYRNN